MQRPCSMASKSTGTTLVKPTFAKVAASAYTPSRLAQNVTNANSDVKQNITPAIPVTVASTGRNDLLKSSVNTAAKPEEVAKPLRVDLENRGSLTATAQADQSLADGTSIQSPASSETDTSSSGAVKPPGVDDGSTHVSSSDSFVKQPAFDSKSLASVTTFGMDEKESLRPDDSASIRAVEDEDQFSAPGTGAAGSRIGSDTDARAFSDQLREISVMVPRGVPVERYQPTSGGHPPIVFGEAQMVTPVQPQVLGIIPEPLVLRPGVVPIPDEKLLEALASHRDRLFVLKLEQDIIDFIRDSKEMRLILPQTHSFYRMLAHKLADYYFLNHMVDQNGTGAAVIIEKTNVSGQLPPPLSSLPNPVNAVSTPPPNSTARKIMRRDGVSASGTSTTLNSEGPSKTTSEAGEGSGSSEVGQSASNGVKSKSNMTREEREAKYKEARERIFGVAQEGEEKENEVNEDDNDVSRTSSATGKKKQPKKQKAPIDDDFEPRSQFANSYYQPVYGQTGFAPDAGYSQVYPSMVAAQHYPGYPPQGQGQAMYLQQFPPMAHPDNQVQFSVQPQTFMPPGMGHATNPGYDLSAQFQRVMQPFSGSSPSPQTMSSMGSPPQGSFPSPAAVQQGQFNPGWQQMGYNSQQYAVAPGGYPMASPLGSPSQMPPQYMYPGSPNPSYPQPAMPNNQAAYNRGSFNPQSQAFIPNTRGGPQMNMSPQFQSYNGGTYPNQMPSMPRSAGPMNGTYNSIRHMSTNGTNHTTQSGPSQMTPAPTLPQSLPQPPNPDSSIAKWGTPSHLPPKPPPPASMEPQKYNELNRGLQGFPGLPRITGNGSFAQSGLGPGVGSPRGAGQANQRGEK